MICNGHYPQTVSSSPFCCSFLPRTHHHHFGCLVYCPVRTGLFPVLVPAVSSAPRAVKGAPQALRKYLLHGNGCLVFARAWPTLLCGHPRPSSARGISTISPADVQLSPIPRQDELSPQPVPRNLQDPGNCLPRPRAEPLCPLHGGPLLLHNNTPNSDLPTELWVQAALPSP